MKAREWVINDETQVGSLISKALRESQPFKSFFFFFLREINNDKLLSNRLLHPHLASVKEIYGDAIRSGGCKV